MPRILLSIAALAAATALPATGSADGSIEFGECRISAGPGYPGLAARCGTLQRPLDPDNPGAGTIDLYVAVVPALSLEPAAPRGPDHET